VEVHRACLAGVVPPSRPGEVPRGGHQQWVVAAAWVVARPAGVGMHR
jgi:hypothetical protein